MKTILITRLTSVALILVLLCGAAYAEEDEEIGFADIGAPVEEELPEDAQDADSEEFYIEDSESLSESMEELSSDLELDTSVNPDDLEMNPNLPDDVINILLIGVDSRETDVNEGYQHNDVTMVLSVSKGDGSIKLTSILRDLYVTIPGYKSKARINTAYARGAASKKKNGGALTMRTVNHNFELNCQYYVTINFYGLAAIIDSLGGIDIEMSKGEASAINTYLKRHPPKYDNTDGKSRVKLASVDGVQHLDGVQAVMYARLRTGMKTGTGDFHRTARQRYLLELLLKKVTSDITIDSLFSLIEVCMPYVKTNLNPATMVDLALAVLQNGLSARAQRGEELISQFRIPMDGAYSYKDINGADVLYLGPKNNFPKNVRAMHEFIYGSYYSAK